jgi:hypothetical protein
LSSEDKNSPRLGCPATSLVQRLFGDAYDQRDAESQQSISVPLRGESESTVSTYLALIAIMLLVLSPLFVPVAITVAPWLTSAVRRILRALGLHRPARRLA